MQHARRNPAQAAPSHSDILILGAGLAGTSLAHHLQILGYGGTVTLLDERTVWTREQRWCSWQVPASLQARVTQSWAGWQVRDQSQIARQSGPGLGYFQISAPQFFEHFHRQWRQSDQIQLRGGTRIFSVAQSEDGVTAETSHGPFRAPLCFDARHAGSPALERLDAPGHLHLRQSFVGWTIETQAPIFDARTATLMDFRLETQRDAGQADGVSFAYVLPQSATRALVESTRFGPRALGVAAHEAALQDYLARHVLGGASYQIGARESGELPMASAPLPSRLGARLWALGVAGGAARPSSGYAFARIQNQTAQWAARIADGTILQAQDSPRAPRKYAVLDEIFLDVMAHDAALAQRCFVEMFARVPPAALVRFLSEQSSPADDARLIGALPKLAFCRASARRAKAHRQARLAPRPMVARELAEAPELQLES